MALSATASLNAMFFSFLMVRIPEITSEAFSKSAINWLSNAFCSGQIDTIKASDSERSAINCQISSVKNGMNGCSNFRLDSSISNALSKVALSMGCWYAGLIISGNHEQKSSQTNL